MLTVVPSNMFKPSSSFLTGRSVDPLNPVNNVFWALKRTVSMRRFFCVPTRYVFLTNIKHVFLVLKRTVSLRRFFGVPTTYVLDENLMEKMVFQRSLLSGGLNKIIAVLYAADKVCSPLGLSAPYLGFDFHIRALKPAIMAARVS